MTCRTAAAGLALWLCAAATGLAEDYSQGAASDNPALLYPAFAGRCVDAGGAVAPCPDAVNCVADGQSGGTSGCATAAALRGVGESANPGQLLQTEWTLTKSVSGEYGAGLPRYVAALRPQVDFSHDGAGAAFEGSAGSEWRYLPGQDASYLSSFRAGVLGAYDLSATGSAFYSASVDGSIPDPDDSSLPANTATPPLSLDWQGQAGLRQRLGRVTGEVRVSALRGTVSDTVLDDTSVIDNSEYARTGYGVGGRIGVNVTPVVAVFADAGWGREDYDVASTGLGVELDNATSRLRAGVNYDRGEEFNGEMSLGVLRRGFDDGSLSDITTWLADANVNLALSRSTTLSASVSTDLTPTTEPGASTEINRAASVEAAFAASDTLRLRGSVSAEMASFAGVSEQTNTTTVGVGLDYMVNRFATVFANLTGTNIDDTTDGVSQNLSVEAGISFSR